MTIRGKATMGTVTDVEPLLRGMLLDMKRQGGLTADVTADELRAAAQAFGDDLDKSSADAAADVRETMERSLPKGVRIERVDAQRDGTRVTSSTTFAFDDITLLPTLEVFFERGRESQRPFASFKVDADAGALIVDGAPPTLGAPGASLPAGAGQLRLELEIALPIVDHNASRADGARLSWEIDAAATSSARIRAKYDATSSH